MGKVLSKNPPSPLLSPILHKDDISISFLPVESSDFVLGCSGITTTTFYESSDIQSAKFFLDTRVKHLLKLNPWLTGRLTNQNKQKKLQLIYNPNLDSVNIEHFLKFETTNKRVDESLDYESICNHLSKYTLRKGALSVNKDLSEEPLFRITMLQTSINRFALIMSLCHVIGDGATYYELYAMLHKDTEPRALNAIRKDSSQFETAANLLMNHRYTEWNEWLFSFSSVIQCVYTVIFGPIPKSITVAISNSWIKHQKNKYKDEMVGKDKTSISFISTNDIVTSYLAKLAGYDVILMAANFRGKLSLVNNNDAGNYETLICYNKENMSPMQIRQSITDRLYRIDQYPLPGFFKSFFATKGGFTNWSSFYQQVEIPNSIMKRHQPYGDLNELLPFDFLVIFSPRKGEVEVVGRSRILTSDSIKKHFDSF